MGLIKVEFEFGKSRVDKELIRFLRFIYSFYIVTLDNWKKEDKGKRPKLLDFPLIKFSLISSLVLLVTIPFSAILLQDGKWEGFGQLLLLLILFFTALMFIFLLILIVVSFLYFLFRLTKALSKTVRSIIDFNKEALRK